MEKWYYVLAQRSQDTPRTRDWMGPYRFDQAQETARTLRDEDWQTCLIPTTIPMHPY